MAKKAIKCFQCGGPDCGFWDEVEQKTIYLRNEKGWPICGECKHNDEGDFDDSWIPNSDDDQRMVDDHYIRKYGEC